MKKQQTKTVSVEIYPLFLRLENHETLLKFSRTFVPISLKTGVGNLYVAFQFRNFFPMQRPYICNNDSTR